MLKMTRIPEPPAIKRVAGDAGVRPFWSVMIPTYNPRADYLEETLHSVLQHDSGPEQMQIEAVDDCSPRVDVAALVKAIVADRVQFSRTPKTLRLVHCWYTVTEPSG